MSRVAIIGENSIEYIEKLLEIWNAGDCAVLIDRKTPLGTAHEMIMEAAVHKCYIEEHIFKKCENYLPTNIELSPFKCTTHSATVLKKEIYEKYRDNYSSNEALVIYSSGTTGKSKGIILSHYAISTNANAIIDYMKPNCNDCIYIVKSLTHSSTLIGELLVGLKSNAKLIVAPTIVPPRHIVGNVKEKKATILCLNPMLLSLISEYVIQNKCQFSFLKKIYVSGSILSDKTYERAHYAFKNIPIYNAYGLSEAGPRVAVQRDDCCKNNSVGKPIKGVELILVDKQGSPVKKGSCGIIHINTKSQFLGYISGNEKHKSLYHGWLNSGDVGYIDERDELHIVDRVDDVIVINSHKIYPSDIENQILANLPFNDCAVVPFKNGNRCYIGCLYTTNIEVKDIRRQLMNVLLPYEIPEVFFRSDFMPRTINGKISKNNIQKILQKEVRGRIKDGNYKR
ncbi:MAG: acyl--CoA ligase [Ruminococcaceae bacterium]|nr:acyl--CoA ligase [Oscillospiraceae bacterium]